MWGAEPEVRARLFTLLDQPGVDRVILNPRIIAAESKPMATVSRGLETEVSAFP